MKWRVSCKETVVLVSRAMDERLTLGDRLGMRLHLAICANCTRFARQLHEMRRLFQAGTAAADDAPGLGPAARQRIATALQERLGS
jgi:hypothetical protein